MFVRDGLVRPVSLVRSAVDVRLTLLVVDRRRRRSSMARCAWKSSSSSEGWWRAFVNNDALQLGRRIAVLWNSREEREWRRSSGGSSTSAPASASATEGIFCAVGDRIVGFVPACRRAFGSITPGGSEVDRLSDRRCENGEHGRLW